MNDKRWLSRREKKIIFGLLVVLLLISIISTGYFIVYKGLSSPKNADEVRHTKTSQTKNQGPQTITVTASGDMLYHRPLYLSSFDGEGYDFANDYDQVKPLISSADIALGDFEGTINPNKEIGGFPLFNAPPSVVDSIKDAGFDVIDLAEGVVASETWITGKSRFQELYEAIFPLPSLDAWLVMLSPVEDEYESWFDGEGLE